MARKRAAEELQGEEDREHLTQRRKLVPTLEASNSGSQQVQVHHPGSVPSTSNSGPMSRKSSVIEVGETEADNHSDWASRLAHSKEVEPDSKSNDGSRTMKVGTKTMAQNLPARIFTAGQNAKPWNRGRQFAKCATGQCRFWTWCDTTDRQQRFNEAMDTRLESQSDAEDSDDDNNLERYGEDYYDGIGSDTNFDEDHEFSDGELREFARDVVLRRRGHVGGHDNYSPTPEEVQAVLDGEDEYYGGDYDDEGYFYY
ncbi:hypothetical protein FB451DRAFT_1368161 [Mycena latifolia]|nr:hypothetical protein FB451DRAFT_1368161 [Mycena latifolia]